ncbi:hypothetical protein [Actinomadura macra]|uniref:hypothetical protein n=1 Tax=Actinomadura macra TaxID=46164 RepID=UPI00083182B4|nr:hypothetical protein [Actinomadura macra]
MKPRKSHRLAVMAGAAMLATAISGAPAASARTTETGCGPEVELGSVVYQACSDILVVGSVDYGTEPFMYARNRGITSVVVTVELQRWNYTTSSWETDSTGPRTIAASGDTRYFSPAHTWSCGQDARERVRATTSVGTGDWAEVVTPAPC